MGDRLADDLRLGAGQIAEEILGENTKKNRRKVYHWHAIGALPTFLLGNQLALRPSALKSQITGSERRDSNAA